MKTNTMRNPIVTNLMEEVSAYHREKNIRVFEFENDNKKTITEKTNKYRTNDRNINSKDIEIPLHVARPWLDLLQEHRVLHLPMYGLNPEIKDKENQLFDMLGSQYLFLCAILMDGKVKGFVCMDDNVLRNEKYALPLSIAAFLSHEMEVNPYLDKEEYFVEYLESIDFPTGAFNRNRYMKVVESKKNRIHSKVGWIHLDFNDIRRLNILHGYDYSDKVLQNIVKMTIEHFSHYESQVFRISGDEFAIICMCVDEALFSKLFVKLSRKFSHEKDMNLAMGMAWVKETTTLFELGLKAEQAMREDKSRYYIKKNKVDLKQRLVKKMKKDFCNGIYPIYLQPQIHLKTGKLIGAEALIRKIDKDGNLVFPDSFIPYFEKETVIRYIDLYVLEEVVKLIKEEADQGRGEFVISVNFSRVTLLEKNIVSKMESICRKHLVDPKRICVEITESMNMIGMKELMELSSIIKNAGFLLSLDDYGSNYSNVAVLANIDFDEVKLDKSIIQILHNNDKAKSIVSATINMCKGFKGTRIIAEGIETKETLDILKIFQCDYGQGYYFSKAISIDEFKKKYTMQVPFKKYERG